MNTSTSILKGKRILLMAGGTGGHVFPALALGEDLAKAGAVLAFLGSQAGMEQAWVEGKMPFYGLSIRGIRGSGLGAWLKAPYRVAKALQEARTVFQAYQPDLCIGMGGFASGPGGIMAILAKRPLIIHEQNAIMGLTNRFLSWKASRVCLGLPLAKMPPRLREKTLLSGNPLRRAILAYDKQQRQAFPGIEKRPLRLLVLGGSRGALALNRLVPEALQGISPKTGLELRHQTGQAHLQACQAAYKKANVKAEVLPFIDNMTEAYAWADLAICRAGALTVSELASVGLPSILIPYPFAVDDHQTYNAQYLVQAKAADCYQEVALGASELANCISGLMKAPEALYAMQKAACTLPIQDASQSLLHLCEELLL